MFRLALPHPRTNLLRDCAAWGGQPSQRVLARTTDKKPLRSGSEFLPDTSGRLKGTPGREATTPNNAASTHEEQMRLLICKAAVWWENLHDGLAN